MRRQPASLMFAILHLSGPLSTPRTTRAGVGSTAACWRCARIADHSHREDRRARCACGWASLGPRRFWRAPVGRWLSARWLPPASSRPRTPRPISSATSSPSWRRPACAATARARRKGSCASTRAACFRKGGESGPVVAPGDRKAACSTRSSSNDPKQAHAARKRTPAPGADRDGAALDRRGRALARGRDGRPRPRRARPPLPPRPPLHGRRDASRASPSTRTCGPSWPTTATPATAPIATSRQAGLRLDREEVAKAPARRPGTSRSFPARPRRARSSSASRTPTSRSGCPTSRAARRA